ncbi:MAG: phosphate acyltransferase PlsX [Anaerolineae bacterium]
MQAEQFSAREPISPHPSGHNSHPRVGIDLMGGDTSPELLLEAVVGFAQEFEEKTLLTLIGAPAVLSQIALPPSISSRPAPDVILMDDDPLLAVRRKKESSLCIGMSMLAKKEIDAFISLGNTGALITSATLCLPMLPNIKRPALLTLIPTKSREVAVIDVGANTSYKADHLVQFAAMGIAYQKSRGITHPKVGLLNIGSEAQKGTPELREVYQKLQLLSRDFSSDHPIFIGNVEGREVFRSEIDVLVTDGFTGNIFLKTAEGIGSLILDLLEEYAKEDYSPHLKAALSILQHRLHYAQYPGAILCGVEGIVVKCHGNSPPEALINSIKGATRLVEHRFLEKIKKQLNNP